MPMPLTFTTFTVQPTTLGDIQILRRLRWLVRAGSLYEKRDRWSGSALWRSRDVLMVHLHGQQG